MNKFIIINNLIINKELIQQIEIERDAEKIDDYDYKDGLRTTDIYVKIQTTQETKEFVILDDDFTNFVDFIQDFYELDDYSKARSKAILLIENAPIRNTR